MLTTEGKNHIKRYLAGYVPAIAQSVSFGIGQRAEALTDIALHLETAKSPINLTTYDFVNNDLVYKAPIPDEYVGKIYEVGVYSLASDPAAGDFSSRLLTTFDSGSEDWVHPTTGATATFTSSATRVGNDSLAFAPTASTTMTWALQNIALDLGGYSAADSFSFALNVANTNTSAVRVRFLTDGANYYDFNLGTQTAGYKIVEVTKSNATVTGTPNWTVITEIQVSVTSNASGASSVEFEAIRIEDKDAASLDYILVARKVLATPVTKIAGQAQDLEFYLDVNIT